MSAISKSRVGSGKPKTSKLWILGGAFLLTIVVWLWSILNCNWIYARIGPATLGVVSGGGYICLIEVRDARFSDLDRSSISYGSIQAGFWADNNDDFRTYPNWCSLGLIRHEAVLPDHSSWNGIQSTQELSHVFARTFYVPYPILSAILAVLAGVEFRYHMRVRKIETWRASGRCPNCGYDLRASPDHCPECGATFVSSRS